MAQKKTKDLNELKEEILKTYKLDPKRIPTHIAIIMDGNGRWAKKRFLPRNIGHKQGSEALRKTLKACVEVGVKYLSVYTFSTENWKRPEGEVSFLMNLFKELIIKEIPELNKEGARVRCLGALEDLAPDVQKKIREAEEATSNNNRITLNLMLNYGSQKEITDAARLMAKDIVAGKLDLDTVDKTVFEKYLYTSEVPHPEMLIRTSGEIRTSNYLLWQTAYSEFFFIDTLWPDFNREELFKLIKEYQQRDRRFGGLTE